MGMVNEPMVGVSYARPSYASNPAPANGATPSGKDPVQIVEAMSKKVSFTLLVEITKFSSLVAFLDRKCEPLLALRFGIGHAGR